MDDNNEFGGGDTKAAKSSSRLNKIAIIKKSLLRDEEWTPKPLVQQERCPDGYLDWKFEGSPE